MDSPHSGHRERLRQQFLANGLESMPQHQILEMLLFYAIPRIDTNELAHRLISRFGSLKGVFDADINELVNVQGMGKNAAVLIKLIPQVSEVYFSSVYDGAKLEDIATISSFLVAMYNKIDIEILRLICLDDNMRMRDNVILSKGDSDHVVINQRIIMQKVLNSGCSYCVLAHNHPNASSKPSKEDISATKMLVGFLNSVGITLIDHIIIGDDGTTAIINSGFCEI